MTGPVMTRPARARIRAGVGSRTGLGSAATLALALLTAGCVLLALAGPKLALTSRTNALRELLGGTTPLARSLEVSANWTGFTTPLADAFLSSPQEQAITDDEVAAVTSQLRRDFTSGPLRPAPLRQAWAGMSTDELAVAGSFPTLHGQAAQLEVMYRSPFTRYARLVAGAYPEAPAGPAPRVPASPATATAGQPPGGPGSAVRVPLNVAVTVETARRFGLRPGSVIKVGVPNLGVSGQVVLTVTGVIAPEDPGSTFWTVDPTAARPGEVQPPGFAPSYWIGAVFVAPSEVLALQRALGPRLDMTWQIPLTVSGIRGEAAQPLYDALSQVTTQPPAMPGDLEAASTALSISTGLQDPLREFLATTTGLDTLQALLIASLALTAAVVLAMAGRMVALRREPELTLMRARGASLRQVTWTGLRGALIGCVPAAALATLIVIFAIPGGFPRGRLPWLVAAGVLIVACLGPALAGAWPQRHGALSPRRARPRRSARARHAARAVAEVTACALAVAALVVLREHGPSARSTIADLFTSAGPALVAVPVVIVEQRLYPLALRGGLRIAARRRGATAFLALAGATRTALTPALPTFALVLALTVAAFGGMVRAGITAGDVTTSWLTVGADVSVTPGPTEGTGLGPEGNVTFTPAEVRAIAGVPGVQHMATIYRDGWNLPGGQQVTGIAVDPAAYAALVAATPGYWPGVPARLLAPAAGGTVSGGTVLGDTVPVLATPDVAAMLGTGAATARTPVIQPVTIRVAGVLSSTPALPGIGSFLVAPTWALHGVSLPASPNVILLTGANIDQARLAAVLAADLPGAQAVVRGQLLAQLTQAPLQHGVFDMFALAVAASAVLGLTVLLLVLALGAAGRERTLARLATMGLSARQRAWLVLLEVGPAVLAAAVAGAACTLLLPGTLGPVIDLSAFTGAGTPVSFGPDALSVGLPVAGLAALAALALTIEIRAGRRLGIAPQMRGEG
jgi:putative ABC transport system permease protein